MLLTEPVPIGSRQAPSRVMFGPHETNLGRGRSLSDRHTAYYARRAEGGSGVIVVEPASVVAHDWPYERAPLADECPVGWEAIATACHSSGAVVLAGLTHAGGQGSSAYSQEVMWAPSRVADVVSREPPAELDETGVAEIVAAFATAAGRAMEAGLDGVEVDAGPYSLVRQFLSGLTNLRQDRYGQDRHLFAQEILAAVRAAVGSAGVVAVRLSCDELAPWAGITPEQAEQIAPALAAPVDLLTVVRGGPFSTSAYRPDANTAPNFNADLCQRIRKAVDGHAMVALQGSVVDIDDAERAVADGVCDLVEMTRAQIADARLVSLARGGEAARVRPCLLCNQACRVRDARNPIVSCVVDPSSGYELDEPVDQSGGGRAAPVLVVGAGPAGLECARVLASAGRAVRVVERTDQPGGVPVRAAVGSGRARIRAVSDWLAAECARLGVDISLSTEAGPEDVLVVQSEGGAVVLATGGRPLTNRYPSGDPVVVDPLSLLGGAALPEGPVVVDDPIGDWVGVGVAEWLAGRGREVTLISPDPVAGSLLSRTGDLADANVRLQRAGVTRVLRSVVRQVGSGQIEAEDAWTGEPTVIPAAVLVDCGHRVPEDSLYSAVADPSLRRAGDCVAPRTILEAVLEGRRVARELLS